MAGSFHVVATPIGNLGDLTQRAAEVLRAADFVLAEDTRHSQKLFQGLSLNITNTQFVSCHQHNEEGRLELVLNALNEGKNVALISDAGTPTISDPGGRLIEKLVAAEITINVCPGASAVMAALMGAGLNTTQFAFLGFLPKKGRERQERIRAALLAQLAVVLYEAPDRVEKTLAALFEICGPCRVVVARELTKKFEVFHRGVLGDDTLSPPLVLKGEMVVLVEAPVRPLKEWQLGLTLDEQETKTEAWVQAYALQDERPVKVVARELASKTGWSRKKAYDAILAHRKEQI